ncbi:MAG TPA: Ig-like domain-containing protein, partial [Nitrososphaeraceae archaeon]|nr:Ig-like domain-containing protein [Nitrososphaeraceae archaeon]
LNVDGVFDNAIGSKPTITFPNSITGYIGLKITDKAGKTDIDYSSINITNANSSPTINSYQPSNLSIVIRQNETIPFFISYSDLEGDIIKIRWFLDNVEINNSNQDSFIFTPTISNIGLHTITASITDSTHFGSQATNQSWIVGVLADDLDSDGWTSIVDCNDNNPSINPGSKEIRYNGIDDDCNSSTLDNNSPPIAKSIKMSTFQNSIATIDLSATDIDKDLLSFSIVDGPQNGTLRNLKVFPFSNSAVVEYVPKPNFHGTDSFTFIASDSKAKSDIAKVDINIGIFESPTAQFQEITINEDTPTEIELRGTSPDGHPLEFFLESRSITRVAGQPGVGTITDFKVTGPYTANLTYTPPPDFSNTLFGFGDIFHFRVSDGDPVPGFPGFESSRASVGITVNNVNDPPEPFNKIVSTVKETPVDISLRSSDGDNDNIIRGLKVNKNLTFGIYSPPSHGTLGDIVTKFLPSSKPSFTLTEDKVTYQPDNGFTGEDSFRFYASDGISQGIGNVTIKVKPTNSISQEFEDGDIVLTSLGTGIHWYKPDGTFVKKLPPAPATSFGDVINVGGAFDSLGNLYVAEFNSLPVYNGTGVSKYNKNGELIDVWKENFGCRKLESPVVASRCLLPESITIDKYDNLFVGGVATYEGGTVNSEVQNEDERDDIRKFDSNGTYITRFNPSVEKRGSDWVELSPDQCTLYYTSEGRHVKQYDVCNDVQMKDFGDAYGIGRSGEDQGSRSGNFPNYALRLLPDGNMLVASESKIVKLNSTGNIVQTYDIPAEDPLFALNLDPDSKSFWTTSSGSHDVYRVDIESGQILQHFTTSLNAPVSGGITGIIIKGEPTLSTAEFPPTVFNQTIFINDNRPLTINLTAFDISNDPLTFAIINNSLHGQLSQLMQISNNMSSLVYTPDPNFDGEDSFTFNANDGSLESNNTGTITIRTNHPPIANSDFANTFEGIPVNIPILANDTDIDSDDTISITSVNSSQTLGNITINRHNSTITYFPFESFSGIDSFNYTISDSHNVTSQAEVTVNIQSLNAIPVANSQTFTIIENTPINITLTGSDSDLNDDLLFLRGAGPQNGFLNDFNRTTGQVQYIPLHNFDGIDTFSFRVFDGKVASEPANVTISIIEDGINDPPVVESERISANVGQPISVNVLENDIDPNGDFLTLTNITGPFNGTAILNQDQTITYHSNLNFNSSDVLYYRVADPSGDFDIGQLIIDVQGNADTQNIQVPSDRLITTTRDQPIDIELIATATIDRPVAFFIIDVPDNGTLGDITTLSNLTSSINYTPNNGFIGDDSFTYVAIDDKGVVSNIGTIRVSIDEVAGNAPVARDSLVTLDEDTSLPIQLDASDSNVNSNLTYSIESQPISGKILSFDSSTGSLVYEPNANFNGRDGFLFKAVDQDGLESNIATVLITVNPVNDPPVANNQKLETDQNTPLQITLSGIDTIDNGNISQFRIVNSPTNGQISSFNQLTGELTYTPNNNFFGSDSFTFKVIDSRGLESTNTGLVTINVKSTQEPPNNEQPPLPLPSSVCTDSNNNIKPKGTQSNDELVGTSQRDTITGLGGNDRFNGCSGDDTLNGNSGNDGIAGGPDDDKLHGNEGNDYLQGDTGSDSLYGNEGNDILVGNEDRDRFFCGSGNDKILDFEYPLDVKSNDCEEF